MSVWHGDADDVVKPENAVQIVEQWIDVHGLDRESALQEVVDGRSRLVWRNHSGDDVIELYVIPGMAHGAPLATGNAVKHCGVPGAFLLDVGISSSYHIAKFFGLTKRRKHDWIFGGWRRTLRSRATVSLAVGQNPVPKAELAKLPKKSSRKRSAAGAALIRLARWFRNRPPPDTAPN
jgi:hypothetical protein